MFYDVLMTVCGWHLWLMMVCVNNPQAAPSEMKLVSDTLRLMANTPCHALPLAKAIKKCGAYAEYNGWDDGAADTPCHKGHDATMARAALLLMLINSGQQTSHAVWRSLNSPLCPPGCPWCLAGWVRYSDVK
jgi:hypothetical protein